MALLQSYSPKDVKISFDGIAVTGLAQNTFLKLRRSSEVIKKTVGAAGETALTFVADQTGEIELTILQTAPTNLILSAALQAQELTRTPTVGVLMVQDPSGSVLAVAKNAWIQGYPEVELSDDQNAKTWTFGCELLEYSATPPGFVEAIPGF